MSATAQARYVEKLRSEGSLREYRRESQRQFRRDHPEKKSAWNKVYKALRSGVLVRPAICEGCGASCKPEASHDDYSRPLDVQWLCKPCHTRKDFGSPMSREGK